MCLPTCLAIFGRQMPTCMMKKAWSIIKNLFICDNNSTIFVVNGHFYCNYDRFIIIKRNQLLLLLFVTRERSNGNNNLSWLLRYIDHNIVFQFLFVACLVRRTKQYLLYVACRIIWLAIVYFCNMCFIIQYPSISHHDDHHVKMSYQNK